MELTATEPLDELYGFWSNLDPFPPFMAGRGRPDCRGEA
jgi:uncharacterized membrane protein